jgi:hypothetical protein
MSDLLLVPADLALHAWDLHVDSCRDCLVSGNDLCYEGQYLADEFTIQRSVSAAPAADTRRPIFTARRRPSFPGAVA